MVQDLRTAKKETLDVASARLMACAWSLCRMKRTMRWLQLPLLKPRQAPMASFGPKALVFRNFFTTQNTQMMIQSDPDSDPESS